MEIQLSSPKCDIFCTSRSLESTEDCAYIEEQVNRIEDHIRELTKLKNNLRRRANHIRSRLYDMPFEVLSHIFSHIIDDSDQYRNWRPNEIERDWAPKRQGLRQILTLTSISFHLRQVALETPELWEQIFLKLDSIKVIRCLSYLEISSLLHDPPTQAPKIKEAGRITPVLSSDIMHRVKALRLQLSLECVSWYGYKGTPLPGWWNPEIWKPTISTFPSLTTLDVYIEVHLGVLDLRKLPLTRLEIHAPYLRSMLAPTCLQNLSIGRLEDNITESTLYKCPNLTKCVKTDHRTVETTLSPDFPNRLTLAHLKRLVWPVEAGFTDPSSIKNIESLNLPVLESLTMYGGADASMEGVVKLCGRVSATLVDFGLVRSSHQGWYDFDATQLLQTPMPHLKSMALCARDVPAVIRALVEHNYSTCFPKLEVLKLRGMRHYIDPNFDASEFVQLLEEQKRSGSACLKLDVRLVEDHWTTELRQELRLAMSDGRVDIVYQGKNFEWLESDD